MTPSMLDSDVVAAPSARAKRWRRATLALAVAISILAAIQARHRATQGRSALLKWEPHYTALLAGEDIYGTEPEGYPTLPLSLLVMSPFIELGGVTGALGWAILKIGLAWWIVLRALALPRGSPERFPPPAALFVVLLSFRVLLSDVLHGNINIVVGATVMASALAWHRDQRFAAGVWAALGTVLKVTPGLLLVYFAWRRSGRAWAGAALGLAAFAWLVPGLWLGFDSAQALHRGWWEQMVAPYATGAPPTLMQTEHINQSLYGVLARLTTDSIAIEARPPVFVSDVRLAWVHLSDPAFRSLHRALAAGVIAALLAAWRRRGESSGLGILHDFALLSLAMLFLSERSWKQHFVLSVLPLASLSFEVATRPKGDPLRRWALGSLAVAGVLVGLSGSAFLGARGSDLAEAYGAFFWGAVALFAGCARCRESAR